MLSILFLVIHNYLNNLRGNDDDDDDDADNNNYYYYHFTDGKK